MADRQQQYRGKEATMPTLLEGELGFCTDTKKLYVGTGKENVLVTGGGGSDEEFKEIEDRVTVLEEKVTAFTGGQITVKLLD